MHAPILVAVVIVAVIVIGFGLWFTQRRRSEKIRQRFGPEYDRTVRQVGGKAKAERVLDDRQKRVARFKIQPLSTADRDRLSQSWREVQAQFVDDPKRAATHADALVTEALRLRGYPMGDFEQRAEDLSVDHPI